MDNELNGEFLQTPSLNDIKTGIAPDWMSGLHGDRYITSVSMPGTHETMAIIGGPIAECQNQYLAQQLLDGIRYIDIRCRHIENVFTIHHGLVYMKMTFGTHVRDVCIDFLKSHPTEFICMMVKEEYKAKDNTRSFAETMAAYIEGYEEYFYLAEGNPTVDEVRGKIVLFRRWSSSKTPMGNLINFVDNDFATSVTTITSRIQDCYKTPTSLARDDKWNDMVTLLDEAIEVGQGSTILYLNYASGSGALCWPNAVAKYTNPRLSNYLQEYHRRYESVFVGVQLIDFYDDYETNLIPLICDMNEEIDFYSVK